MKRLLSFFMTVILVMALVVVPVNGAEAAQLPVSESTTTAGTTAMGETCPCGCGETLSNVVWQVWDPNSPTELSSGHYYLAGDYVQDEQEQIISGDRIVLDLRGHTLTTAGYSRLFLIYGYLAVMDTVGGGVFSAKTPGAYGGVVMVSTNESNDPTFELHSGTIMPDTDNKGSKRGGLIHLGENSTFRMTGGRLLNGTTVNEAGTNFPGGLVAGAYGSARIEILGGELIGGYASTHGGAIYNLGTTVLKNCRITGGEAAYSGGNVCQNGGTLTMENCTVSHGVSHQTSNGGGNVCLMGGAKVTIKDSTINNGYTAAHGGNLFVGTAYLTIENSEIFNGVAAGRGNNLYGATSAKSLTIRDCQIPGDVGYVGKDLTLTGLVKIGLLNSGLKLWYDTSVATVDASALTEGSEIYVDATGTFAENANAAYFKGAMRTVITESEGSLVAAQAASGETGGYCPHCGEAVVWNAFSTSSSKVQNCLLDSATDTDPNCSGLHLESGHYYMTSDYAKFSQFYIGVYLSGTKAVKDVVIDLAGHDVTAFGRAFYIRPDDAEGNNNQLTLLDSCGNGILKGSGSTSIQGGGVLYNDGGILNIYGGTYQYVLSSARVVTNGGLIYNSDTLNVYGGILDGSQYAVPETDPDTTKTLSYKGGTLNQPANKTLNITAGRFVGGSAWTGGNLYLGASKNISITGGQFHGGTAVSEDTDSGGGNIRLYGTSGNRGEINFSGCSITGGTVSAAKGGGNLSVLYYTATLDNCYMEGGTSSSGGNLNCSSGGKVTFTDSIVLNGESAGRGGNIHVATTTSHLTLDNTLLACGSGTIGGNLNAGIGYNNIRGGEVSFGRASSYGGNICAAAGNYTATSDHYTRIQADTEGNVPLIAGGYAKGYGGNIYIAGVLYLDAAQIQSGYAGTSGLDMCLNKASNQGKLEIGAGVTGDLSMSVSASLLGDGVYGKAIATTVCNTLNANITLEGDYDSPILCAKDGSLFVGAVTVEDSSGNMTWYTDSAPAVAACGSNSFLKLYADQDIVLTKDCAVDLNGKNANISGAYTLSGMDSSGDGFTVPTGTATVAEETTVNSDFAAPNGNRYLHLDGKFHRVQLQITDVALRPSADGLYYSGVWSADETVTALISSYGMAVSTVNAPGSDFATDEDTLYTSFATDTLTNGEKKNGVLISGILKADRSKDLNNAYGQMPVFASAYMTLSDGRVLLSDNVGMSLRDIMQAVDKLIVTDPQHYRRLTLPMRAFYEKWENQGMDGWELNKIPDPGDDGILNILMIGNSFCSYYVQELWALGQAAGIPMRVCNVYYSGCRMSQHYNWWLTGEANYVFYTTEGPERVGQTAKSLEWCLGQYDWDVISLQEGSGVFRVGGEILPTEEAFARFQTAYDTLVPYLQSQFPEANFYWHHTWAYQVGYKRDGDSYTVTEKSQQDESHFAQQAFADLVCERYGLTKVPSGDAWKIIRDGGYDKLCSRLGRDFYGEVNGGDYYHDGDIGGGQYLNACVWFETITGQSCIGTSYVPTYELDGETYSLNIDAATLQAAAHQAVAEYRATQEQ